MIESLNRLRESYPDLRTELKHVVVQDDIVALLGYWRGTDPSTGRSFNVLGLGFERVVDGQIAESWFLLDTAAMQQQLGG